MNHKYILSGIIALGIIIRIAILWLARPEFVGWFNHTYYYYVETKGILTNGTLPFPDMPFLFYLYALTAKTFNLIAFDLNSSIIHATKFWMSLLPSLIAIPVYLILSKIEPNKAFNKQLWILVFASAFLPLTILHMPEFLQKNILGFLLLSIFIFLIQNYLETHKKSTIFSIGIIAGLIILTHFGSTGAMLLYVFSFVIAQILSKKDRQTITRNSLIIGTFCFIAFIAIAWFDIKRLDRILFYAQESLNHSLLGTLFSKETLFYDKLSALGAILLPILLLGLLLRSFNQNKAEFSIANQQFFLTNIIATYLLMLPIYDQLLLARLVQFSYVPILIIIGYIINLNSTNRWIKRTLLIFIATGTLTMLLGEYMSSKFHNRNGAEIYSDLMTMKEQVHIDSNDLILTRNGAEHIANWFLNSKASLITSFNKNDLQKYQNIYILNPTQGQFNMEAFENKTTNNEANRYYFMLRNIPAPKASIITYQSPHIELLKIEKAPEEWVYDTKGNWLAYQKTTQ